MSHEFELENGRLLVVENDGETTLVSLSSGSHSQQQSQSTGFSTGKWAKAPQLFRVKRDLVLRVNTKVGSEFIQVRGDQIESLSREPDLENAEKLTLKKSSHRLAMQPMKPMEPMQPMKPLEPMKPMRPMEMNMGGMRMSMGSSERERESDTRFCTQCSKPA